MKKQTHVLLTGPLPPPAGGISVHIWRLKHVLEPHFLVDFVDEASQPKPGYFNIHSFNIIAYFRKISSTDVVFIHSGNKLFKKLHITMGKLIGKKVIITLHGYGKKRILPLRMLDSFFFSLADKIILVNAGIKEKVSLPERKCVVQHAFLPPILNEEQALPAALNSWMQEQHRNKQILVVANASRLDTHLDQDLYGLDMCIEAANSLVKKNIPVRFIFIVSSLDKGAERFSRGLKQIQSCQLENKFLLQHEKLSFVRLIEQSDIVVRPTNTDGDALTIREGLFLGKAVLASDVTSRPAGTNLFQTRNQSDFESQLEKMIQEALKINQQDKVNTLTNTINDGPFYVNLINSVITQHLSKQKEVVNLYVN